MTDREIAEKYKRTLRSIQEWRRTKLELGVDYMLFPGGPKPAKWLPEGIKKAEERWGTLVRMRIYQWCPNPKYVKVCEEVDRSKKGIMVLPKRWMHKYQNKNNWRIWGYRTDDPEVYDFAPGPVTREEENDD